MNWKCSVNIDHARQEVYGFNTEREDYLLGPGKASGLKAYFVSRPFEAFTSFGITEYAQLVENGASTAGYYTVPTFDLQTALLELPFVLVYHMSASHKLDKI